jgi:hypothetical protein|tara:strand:- start:300 stop:506 length:207 start_codon:yes stop_codon:yes gene_type:complete
MTQAKYKRMFKKSTKAIDFIQELKLDIQYLTAAIDNGWYKNQTDRNNKASELEGLEKMLKDIKQELNN